METCTESQPTGHGRANEQPRSQHGSHDGRHWIHARNDASQLCSHAHQPFSQQLGPHDPQVRWDSPRFSRVPIEALRSPSSKREPLNHTSVQLISMEWTKPVRLP